MDLSHCELKFGIHPLLGAGVIAEIQICTNVHAYVTDMYVLSRACNKIPKSSSSREQRRLK